MKEKRFYPDYLSEILVVMLVCIEIVLMLALLYPQSIGRQIDFTRQFQPRPEWYFLWLFQLVGYFPGDTAFIGTLIIPLLYVFLLLFMPYIDRGKKGRLRAIMVGSGLLVFFIVLTLLNVL